VLIGPLVPALALGFLPRRTEAAAADKSPVGKLAAAK
jgi:hypothetical protein